MKYQRRPITVEAYQMLKGPEGPVVEMEFEEDTPPPVDPGDFTIPSEWPKWLHDAWKIGRIKPPSQGAKTYELCRVVTTHRGTLTVVRGNFIVKIDEGEFDVFPSKAFEKHFEPAPTAQ